MPKTSCKKCQKLRDKRAKELRSKRSKKPGCPLMALAVAIVITAIVRCI